MSVDKPLFTTEFEKKRIWHENRRRCWDVCYTHLRTSLTRIINRFSARVTLQAKKSPEALPHTKDAVVQNIRKLHLQASIWYAAGDPESECLHLENFGWKLRNDGRFLPIWIIKDFVPKANGFFCKQANVKLCKSKSCTCIKNLFGCFSACSCKENLCQNPPSATMPESSDYVRFQNPLQFLGYFIFRLILFIVM